MHGLYSFAVITDDRELLLAASSEEEKYKWMEVRFKIVERQESKVTDFFSSACPGFRLQQQHSLVSRAGKKIANSTTDKKVVSSKSFELFALPVCHLSHCNCPNSF